MFKPPERFTGMGMPESKGTIHHALPASELMLLSRRMPELCRFYGIIIRMFSEPSVRHHSAHFHAYYGEHMAVFSILPLALTDGFLPLRQQRLVEAWAELHSDELLVDWNLLIKGRKPIAIPPIQ